VCAGKLLAAYATRCFRSVGGIKIIDELVAAVKKELAPLPALKIKSSQAKSEEQVKAAATKDFPNIKLMVDAKFGVSRCDGRF